jgi:HSP20 family protein
MATFRWPTGWDPFVALRHMQRELERATGVSIFGEGRSVGGGNFPPVNVYNGRDDVLVQLEMPGVKREDLDLSITGETLVVKGAVKPPPDEAKFEYQRRERGTGEFSRTVVLPDKVEAERVEASLAGGVLTVRLPKSEAAKPKQIHVK